MPSLLFLVFVILALCSAEQGNIARHGLRHALVRSASLTRPSLPYARWNVETALLGWAWPTFRHQSRTGQDVCHAMWGQQAIIRQRSVSQPN